MTHDLVVHDLTIVIVSYNANEWLRLTLQTLVDFFLTKTHYSVQVMIVDNNSADTALEVANHFATLHKNITVFKNATNDGYAAANNLILKNNQARYVLLLNSDMELTSESNFDSLITYADEHPEIGVVTPKIMLPNGRLDQACHRGEPTPLASLWYFLGFAKIFPKSSFFNGYHLGHRDLKTVHQIDACSGAAMVVRQTVIEQVGVLDEQFFMYAEDLDWCKRIRDHHHQIVYFPKVTVIHHKYKSGLSSKAKKTATQTRDYFYDTMLLYYDKHYAKQYPNWLRFFVKTVLTIKKRIT